MHCPLCGHHEVSLFFADRVREYYCCSRCRLVHVPLRFHLDPLAEKARYDTHQNDPRDAGYRTFLSRVVRPLVEVIPPGSQGLDFGSGPGPTLSVMLEEKGFQVALYDKYYACRPELLTRTYDFITATEVVEHLSDPAGELDRLWACLRPGGVLAIMTKLVLDQQAFANWHYIRDLTHISFFSHPTFIWLATHLSARLNRVDKDVIMLHKPLCSDVTPDVPDNPTINQPETHHL